MTNQSRWRPRTQTSWSLGLPTLSRVEPPTQANGWGRFERGWEHKFGAMGPSTWGCGRTTRLLGEAPFITSMAMFLRECGITIKPTERGSTLTPMVLAMRGSGRMIYSTARGERFGAIIRNMLASIRKGKSRGLAGMSGRMAPTTRGSGTTIK